jgi:hypothetical protein
MPRSWIYERYLNSVRRLRRSILDQLSTGELSGWGRRNSPTAPITAIPLSAWPYLNVSSYSGSMLVEKTKEKIKIFDVRISRVRKSNQCSAERAQHSASDMTTAFSCLMNASFQRFSAALGRGFPKQARVRPSDSSVASEVLARG